MARIIGRQIRSGGRFTRFVIAAKNRYDLAAIAKLSIAHADLVSDVIRDPLRPLIKQINDEAQRLRTREKRGEIRVENNGSITELKNPS